MGNVIKRISKCLLAAGMLLTAVLGTSPTTVFAAPTTQKMAHLKSGDGNGNAHFGGGKPEAFILSDKKDVTNQNVSFQMKLNSEKAETRFRFVSKYVDDTHWGYLAYDGMSNNWFYEYKNGSESGYPAFNGKLPAMNKGDLIDFQITYESDGLHLKVDNKTTKESGTGIANAASFLGLKDMQGAIGFGGATYTTSSKAEFTDFYFSDVKIGDKAYKDGEYAAWNLYKENVSNQVWEPSVDVVIADDSTPSEPGNGRAWLTVKGGSNNGGGHAYGNASVSAPVLALDDSKRSVDGGTLGMAVKPSANWGAFYTYVDDSNWLYIGWDTSSKWYYQYKVAGKESYPKISGLPDPVPGEEMKLNLSLNRETLSIDVNGTTVRVNNQDLITLAEKAEGKGRFGIKTNGATSISIADVTYNGKDCIEDTWVFCAERAGQKMEKTYTTLHPMSGTVTDDVTKKPISGAVVRVGTNMARTTADGAYSFEGIEAGTYAMAVTKPGYQAYSKDAIVTDGDNILNIALKQKEELDLSKFDTLTNNKMTAYIGKDFPMVARYVMKDGSIFRGNETDIENIAINSKKIKPTITVTETTAVSRTYRLDVKDSATKIDFTMDVKVSIKDNTLTWQVIDLVKKEGCAKIATIDVPGLNLLSVDAVETKANFAGANTSTTTTATGDSFLDFDNGFVPSKSDGYLYGFLSNGELSAGLFSNSEIEGDKRVIRNNGADTMSLTSAPWYYEMGDKNGQNNAARLPEYPTSELPITKVAIADDMNEDGDVDWNDGALAFRSIMNKPYGSEDIKDMVNYRIVMNFASMASNPYLVTADNIKKVYLATDGLPQAVMLKGYGNEGHDSANSEYADIAEREGGVKDFQEMIKIAHDYDTEIGIHVNAQEAYPEAKSFNEDMLQKPFTGGWGWLDQSFVIDKHWDLATQARWKRFVQLYDRINGTKFYDRAWPEAVEDSKGSVKADKKTIQQDAESRPDNMDFIYLDVWYQDAWETRQVAKEINSLGWRFSTEFSAEGEYDSTWQHWSTDASYGGASAKGYNSDIIRFIRNDQRDSQVLNYPSYGGTADNPLLGGYRLYGFEGWGGDRDFNSYIEETFNQNLPTKFLQHYYVTDWENYEAGQSPVGNHEKAITLKNDAGDTVVVSRNEKQRADDNIERTVTLNGKKVLDDVTYLLPWTEKDGSTKLYHWNLDGGTTSWDVPASWNNLGNVVLYELTDQGRTNKKVVPVVNGKVTLNAKAATAYIVDKGEKVKTLKNQFGQSDYVVDPGFNSYAPNQKLSNKTWTGDIKNANVGISKANTGDQRLTFKNPSQDVAVSTTISGLEKGKDYVAEVYVENNSDAKAMIEVNNGKNKVMNYTERSILMNYVKSDQKNGSKMQRMQVSFTAEQDTAKLTLTRNAGAGETYMDDIRIVEKSLDNFKEDGSFQQDYETVVQGLYPFVLSSAQGINDPVTHLSQLNAPYSQAGWNGRVIDDVIDGEWSLKHHGANTGIIYQTLPQNYRFESGKVYSIEFDYQSGPDKAYAMVVGDGTKYNSPTTSQYLEQAHGTTKHVKMNVIGGESGQTWIGLYENGAQAGKGTMGQTDFTLDNLVIREDTTSIFAEVSTTDLYKGETASIVGNQLDKIKWSSSDETVAKLNVDTMKIAALKEGKADITAEFPDGTKKVFAMKVNDTVITDIDKAEYGSLSVDANTEELTGEPGGSGVKEAAADGDSSTYWHSNWSTGGFAVSEANPAILKVHLEKPMEINGFKMQQRPSANNGIVQQFSYRILTADGQVIASEEHITVADDLRKGGAWINVPFTKKSKAVAGAKTIEISIEKGQGNYAALAEVLPIRVQKVADSASLKDTTLRIGEKQKLEIKHPENTMLKGIVWESSNEAVVSVSNDGEVIALQSGKAVISIRNAAGLYAEATVTVKKAEAELNFDALLNQIAKAEALNLNNYKDSKAKQAFIKALKTAKNALHSATSQAAIDKATKDLANAQETLMKTNSSDIKAPTKPSNLKVSAKQYDANVTWKASSDNVGVEGYIVYLQGKKLGTVKDCKAQIEGLRANTLYLLEVRAYDKAGNVSDAASTTFSTKKASTPVKPGTSGTPSIKPPKPNDSVQTGDSTNTTGLMIMMTLAAGAIGIAMYQRKRKQEKQS